MKEINAHQKRVLEFNPSEIYSRIKIDKFSRFQKIGMLEVFPKIGKKCGCGCGKNLEGRRTRWASDDCMLFAVDVTALIKGDPAITSIYLSILFPNWACCKCGVMEKYKEYKNGLSVSAIHKDHIIPIHKGGGGCWLDNYQLLCDDCHKDKTKKDNNL